jgi:kynurenine formamidase
MLRSTTVEFSEIVAMSTRIVVLSLAIEILMPTHALFPSPIVLPFATHESTLEIGLGEQGDPYTYAVNYISMLEHVSTHVDAPLHLDPKGSSIDECPLDWFTGKAVCFDLRHISDLGDIDASDLERAQEAAGVEVDAHIVLLCTGFHRRHWPRRSVVTSNPGLTAAATEWLADRGSRVHGVEGPSTDKAGTTGFPSHRVCRERGLVHYEWLVNLEELLGQGEVQFTGLPLKWVGGTGSPVRACAFL